MYLFNNSITDKLNYLNLSALRSFLLLLLLLFLSFLGMSHIRLPSCTNNKHQKKKHSNALILLELLKRLKIQSSEGILGARDPSTIGTRSSTKQVSSRWKHRLWLSNACWHSWRCFWPSCIFEIFSSHQTRPYCMLHKKRGESDGSVCHLTHTEHLHNLTDMEPVTNTPWAVKLDLFHLTEPHK